MTLRRLNVLIDWLSPDARLWQSMEAAKTDSPASAKPTIEHLRERQAFYDKKKEAALND